MCSVYVVLRIFIHLMVDDDASTIGFLYLVNRDGAHVNLYCLEYIIYIRSSSRGTRGIKGEINILRSGKGL